MMILFRHLYTAPRAVRSTVEQAISYRSTSYNRIIVKYYGRTRKMSLPPYSSLR
jgi:hypothetical protein